MMLLIWKIKMKNYAQVTSSSEVLKTFSLQYEDVAPQTIKVVVYSSNKN
jgi:hypothetical protein